jgi:hypothetical protein
MHILYSHPDYQELQLQVQPRFKVGDKVVYKGKVCTITFMDEVYYDFDGGVAGCRIELQDELLSAAPKFKVGDWIISVHPDAIFKVGDVKKTTYKLIDIYGDGYDCQITEIDKNYHLWSIADAKYGDVFANTAGCILIAKDNESCLCYIDKNGGFHADNNKWFFVDFSDNALTPATQEQRGLLFAKMKEEGYEWDAGKKELRKTIEPTFKVGDWVVTDYGKVSQVVSVDNAGDGYTLDDGVYFSGSWCDMYHLWTIADAKDGDVLSSIRGCPFIYDKYRNQRNDLLYYYAGIDGRGNFVMKCPKKMLYHFGPSTDAVPATKEQRDLLLAKMREAGYLWDAEKKELRKIFEPQFKVGDDIKTGNTIDTIAEIDYATRSYLCKSGRTIWFENQDLWHLVPKPHYGIANFHEGMPVLVRNGDCLEWEYVTFTHYRKVGTPFCAGGQYWYQCIPFSEETKHLLGTTGMPDERFINW